MGHANARLTVHGRRIAIDRVAAGYRVADVAAQLGCSRTTIYKWVHRHQAEGEAGLVDRSSRPHRFPQRTPVEIERQIIRCRVASRRGAGWIADELGVPASTVGRVIRRAGLPALSRLDALTGELVRTGPVTGHRYERDRPGDLIHVDVKKLGRIPPGGGWRAFGRRQRPNHNRGLGFDYLHSAIDDHTRIAYTEIHPDQQGPTCAGFLTRAATFFADLGVTRIGEVMTDNALNYSRSHDFQKALRALRARHVLIRPHCPWQNGKIERFNRTLTREWAYSRIFLTNTERAECLPDWLEYYNTRRRHNSLGGHPPISRLPTTS